MRIVAIGLAGLALSACGGAKQNAPPEHAFIGAAQAQSVTAVNMTGDIDVAPMRITFSRGIVAETESLGERPVDEAIGPGAGSYALLLPGVEGLSAELRRVTSFRVSEANDGGARAPAICPDDSAPSYIALVYDYPTTQVKMVGFTGADAPGPMAEDSQVCGALSFYVR